MHSGIQGNGGRRLVRCPVLALALILNALIPFFTAAAPVDEYFYEAYVAEAHGEYDRAIPDWNEVLRLNPNNLAAMKNRGLAYLHKEDWAHSIADYSEAIRRKPNDVAAFDGRGYARFQQDNWDQAIGDFEAAIRLNPRNWALYRNLGRVYLMKGDWDTAITNFTKTIQLNPRDDWAYNCRAYAFEEQGNLDAAIADYRRAIQISPNYANVYLNCGNLFRFERKNLAVTLVDYNEAIRLSSTNIDAYLARAGTWYDLTNFPAALEDYNTAVQLNPAIADSYCQRGWFQRRMTNLDAALGDYREAVRLNPTNVWYWSNLAWLHEEMTNYEKAIVAYSRCIGLQATNADYYADRARAEEIIAAQSLRPDLLGRRRNMMNGALDDWNQAAVLDDRYLLDLGRFESLRGQYDNAIDDLSQLLQKHPDDYFCRAFRAFTFERAADRARRNGQLDQTGADLKLALQDWNQIAAVDNGPGVSFLCFRGDFHARQSEFAAALADYRQAVDRAPTNCYPQIALAWFLSTCPDRKFRNGAEALTLAKRACETRAGESGFCLAGLAAASAETGDFVRAVKYQKQALEHPSWPAEMAADMRARLAFYEEGWTCHRLPGWYGFD